MPKKLDTPNFMRWRKVLIYISDDYIYFRFQIYLFQLKYLQFFTVELHKYSKDINKYSTR